MWGEAVDIGFKGKELYPRSINKWKEIGKIANKYWIDWGYDLWGKDKPHFQDNGKDIFAPDSYRWIPIKYSNDFNKKKSVGAFYLRKYKRIVITSTFFQVSLERQQAILLHESWHHVQNIMPKAYREVWKLISNKDPIIDKALAKKGIVYKENGYVTKYAETNESEDFSECLEEDYMGRTFTWYTALKVKIAKKIFSKYTQDI